MIYLRVFSLFADQLLLEFAQGLDVFPLRLSLLKPGLEGPEEGLVRALHLFLGVVES